MPLMISTIVKPELLLFDLSLTGAAADALGAVAVVTSKGSISEVVCSPVGELVGALVGASVTGACLGSFLVST